MATFGQDNRTDNWLKHHGIPVKYTINLSLDSLQGDWNLINLGRPDGSPTDEDLILRYATAQESGATFPAPVIATTHNGYEVLDGCQRLSAAALNGYSKFNAYVVMTDDVTIRQRIRICANNVLNGKSEKVEWTVKRAVNVLFEQFGDSVKDIMLWTGFPEAKIRDEITSRKMSRWLTDNGVDITKKPANQKGFLCKLRKTFNDTLLRDAPKEVCKVVRLCQAIKSNNSEAENVLSNFNDLKQKKGVRIATQINSKLGAVQRMPEIKGRLNTQRKQHPIDNAVRALASAVTSLRNAQKHHSDDKQSRLLIENLVELQVLSKKIVPHEHWIESTSVMANGFVTDAT